MKYTVSFIVHATTYVEVEADSEEEAREKAKYVAEEPCLCWQCANALEIGCLGDIANVEEVKP